jgi:hypothetical protein
LCRHLVGTALDATRSNRGEFALLEHHLVGKCVPAGTNHPSRIPNPHSNRGKFALLENHIVGKFVPAGMNHPSRIPNQ